VKMLENVKIVYDEREILPFQMFAMKKIA